MYVSNSILKKTVSMVVSAGIGLQFGFFNTSQLFDAGIRQIYAATNYSGALVASQGKNDQNATIRGQNAEVVYDSTLKSNVLSLNGDSFGSGWLQLPSSMFKEIGPDGFTLSMKFELDSGVEDYMRLFQFSSIPFGTGTAPNYSSPDISVDLSDRKSYRGSVFVGKTSNTQNDNSHRSIFNISAVPDSGTWHDLKAVYSKDSAKFYLDGRLLTLEKDETLKSTLNSLFTEDILQYYTYNSIGHSLYTDHDIKARVDNIAFYDYALSDSQISSMPDDASLLYTFEPDTITEGTGPEETQTTVSLDGTLLTSVPSLQTSSPDNTLTTKLWTDAKGCYYYSVDKLSGGVTGTVIEPSKLGLGTSTENLSEGFSTDTPVASRTSNDETYTLPYGKHSTYKNKYNEISFPLIKGESVLTVFIRIYDDGMGFRYSLNHGAEITSEASQVVFPQSGMMWGSGPNATYEWDINEFSVQKMTDSWADYSVPLMGNFSNKYWVLLSEANVFNEEDPYCASYLKTTGGSRALTWRFGIKAESVKMSDSFSTPWRAAIIADNLNDMSGSDLILNLNPESKIKDTSWIKPGKIAWSWWSSGGDSPIEYHTQKDYIDFAAANGWDYVCLDFGWALWDNSAAKVKELCEYGASKGVGITLWYGVNNKGHSGYKDSAGHPAYPYYSLLDEVTIVREFERIKGLGVRGVKVDYYESDTQETMKQMHLCADIAAKNNLLVLFHGCTLPRGESRTYPNVVSYEAVNGTEYYKWFESPKLTNRITYTFTRNVVGSADFTPTGTPIYGIKATAGFALADVVTIESGLQHFAQSVYTYEGSSALPFLNDVPVSWDDIHIIDGYPMDFNVTARRSGSNWYVGASTIDPRSIEIKLSDLISDDGTYNAYIFGDNADGSDIEVTVLGGLTKDSVIKRNLLANGGCAIKITKGTMRLSTPYSNYKFYEAENASISGKASITSGKSGKYCSGDAYVGYIGAGGGNNVTFNNVTADKDGEYTLRIYYVSGETRSLQVDVNGSFVTTLSGLFANKNDWSGICATNTTVKLKAGNNTIRLYNNNANAPSIDRIAVFTQSPDEDILYGDINFDGQINIIDVILIKSGLLYGFDNSKAQKAADINQNGTAAADDLIQLILYMTDHFSS